MYYVVQIIIKWVVTVSISVLDGDMAILYYYMVDMEIFNYPNHSILNIYTVSQNW